MSNNLKDLEAMHNVVKEFRTVSKANRAVLLNMLGKEHDQIGDVVDDPYFEIKKRYLAAGGRSTQTGNFVSTIRDVRNLHDLSLKEAKELVESW